jgi:F420-dependent oxidoreductase-like protein
VAVRERIGVVVNRSGGVEETLALANRVEELGYGSAWMTSGSGDDCMPLFAAMALTTESLMLGTAVVQTYPRHPLVLASEANVLDQLSSGRFRLGIGPSHRELMESMGIRYRAPLGHLREYVKILKELLTTGSVEFRGEYYQTVGSISRTADVPVLVGTLQPATFRLVGALADGAITWLCPPKYLEVTAIPAMHEAAEDASRDRPALIAHLAVCIHDDGEAVRSEVRRSIPNIRYPAYQRMLVSAGYPDAAGGVWTDALIDGIVAWGSEESVSRKMRDLFEAGADEVMLRPIGIGDRAADVIDRTISHLANV